MSPLSWRCQPWEHRAPAPPTQAGAGGEAGGGSSAGIYPGNVAESGFVSAQGRRWWHRAPMSPWSPGSACRDGHKAAQGAGKAGSFGAGIDPPTQRRQQEEGCRNQEHAGVCSGNIPCSAEDFSPLEGSHESQEGARIPDELQGSGKAAPSHRAAHPGPFQAGKLFLGSSPGWTEPTFLPKALGRARESRRLNLLK